MLKIYTSIMGLSAPLLKSLLYKRSKKGKEDVNRLGERMGIPGKERSQGPLAWFHAASVGEAQSTLILINKLLESHETLSVMVTTGTVTSAAVMEKNLPKRAFHQFYPLDHPQWVASFLDHWKPDLVLWTESELWPNMLCEVKKRAIPAALVNARLSPQSFKRWKLAKKDIEKLLATFAVCLAQTEEDAGIFKSLGGHNVVVSGNLKYSAAPLPFDRHELVKLEKTIGNRPVWVYASTHEGEEDMACRIHRHLLKEFPDLLTIIVPRHPERRQSIKATCEKYGLNVMLRSNGKEKEPPQDDTGIYIADTMGELGLFYRLAPIACIGRSFSNDGGGGHNPIEAAQLGCAVLHGPNVQNLSKIYEEFDDSGAALKLKNEADFQNRLQKLFSDSDGLAAMQNKATSFTNEKAQVLKKTMSALAPVLDRLNDKEDGKEQVCA